MSVNVVRKATNKEDVQALAKTLIKSWKKLLDGQAEKQKVQRQASDEKVSSTVSEAKASNDSQPANNNVVAFPPLRGDVAVRTKCIQMIQNSLKSPERASFQDGEKLATQLEAAIFNEFNNTEMKYKNRIKSRVLNLRDKKNPDLLLNFLDGYITPTRLAKMTSEEMASDDLKKEREKFVQEGINDHQMSVTGGTTSTMMKCGKCGKNNVTYNQLQTRSSDEPMTTFCFCNECGHRWKFC